MQYRHRRAEEIGQLILAMLERLLAEIEAVELDQVEGAEHRGMIVMPITEEFEDREPLPVDDDRLTVDDARLHRQGGHRGSDLRETGRKIVAVTSEQPYAVPLAPGQDAEAVVLDFVNPAEAGRRRVCPLREAGQERDGVLDTAPLGQDRHAVGIDGRAGGVEHWNAALQRAKATTAAKAIPNPVRGTVLDQYKSLGEAPVGLPGLRVTEERVSK
jgi:hypothetical protein